MSFSLKEHFWVIEFFFCKVFTCHKQRLKKNRRVLKLEFVFLLQYLYVQFLIHCEAAEWCLRLQPTSSAASSASRDNHSPFCILFVIFGMIINDKKEMVLQIRDVEKILISADLKQQRTWHSAPYLGRHQDILVS